ncbi:hypothetical protein Poli38472_005108 [Pythium oligandrum]|uniref:DNA excision repair protein ERCC-1 n=1 Tax=Pythium oligandrum TaxID=41045 RepID=A0A8K1FG86_PYTOL|nr:hypothetical protein Poli38472_005108 [Pythium oligandrum]|eukprot:TMW62490.1 hypothetical protein Poli38472_005108 [Pythium oligandrum]
MEPSSDKQALDASATGDDTANAARSRFDSRALQSSTSETINLTHADDDEEDIDTSSRYLTHARSSSLTFDEAFAAIKQTASYTKPPRIAVEPLPSATKDSATVVFVNRNQTGNPLLKAVKNVSLEFRDGLVPDYVVNPSCCVLFLSVRYHLLHTNYLDERLQRVKKDDVTQYKTKVVLCFVDVDDNEIALREINRVTLLSQFTLILAWSWLEAARYLETLKAYENKSATLIKEKVDAEFLPQANDVFTTIRSVNKTDVVTLLSTFGSVEGVMNASLEELSLCPGIGAKKVRQLLETFNEPLTKES